MSFKLPEHKNLKNLIKHFRALAENDPDLSNLPAEISPSGLQLALVRAPVTLQNNFTQLSNISGGIRSLPAALTTHAKYGIYFRPYIQRIGIAHRAIFKNNNQLIYDLALIELFSFFALGMESKDNQLRSHVENMMLGKL